MVVRFTFRKRRLSEADEVKDIFALRLYTRVARLGSFSAAARECGLSQSQASRIVADLEADLGTRLLSRSTRAVVPTETGAEFLARIETILGALDEAEHSVRGGGDLRGLVRLSTPTSFGIRTIIPHLAAFTAKHPDLQIHFLLEDSRRDLVRDAVDVAVRLGRLVDSSATAKLIATIPRVIVAAPTYLAQAGAPSTPTELTKHRIVGGSAAAVPTAWVFARGAEKVTVDLQPHFSTNENEGAVAAAAAGLGITSTSEWACQRELGNGSLVRLLTDWKTADIPVHAYFPMGSATRAAARALVDHLAAQFHDNAIHVRHT
jgi:DNA-binding transcriptional LysR family regulator